MRQPPNLTPPSEQAMFVRIVNSGVKMLMAERLTPLERVQRLHEYKLSLPTFARHAFDAIMIHVACQVQVNDAEIALVESVSVEQVMKCTLDLMEQLKLKRGER